MFDAIFFHHLTISLPVHWSISERLANHIFVSLSVSYHRNFFGLFSTEHAFLNICRFSSVGPYITYWLMSNFQNKIKTHLILSYQRPVTFCWGLTLFFQPLHCTNGRCTGSIMIPRGGETPQPRSYGTPRDKEEVTIHAEDFLKQYFASIAR